MDLFADFFAHNMILVFLVSGLAWFAMGFAIALETRASGDSQLARSLRYLALFGILHAFVEWSDLLQIIPPEILAASGSSILRPIKLLLLGISSLFLLHFGVELLVSPERRCQWLRRAPVILFVVWLLGPTLLMLIIQPGTVHVPDKVGSCLQCHSSSSPSQIIQAAAWLPINATMQVWARYSLYMPGMLLSAAALLAQARVFRRQGLGNVAAHCRGAALALAVNSVLAGLIVAPAPYYPASVLNYHTFTDWTSVPPQVLRAMMALVIAYFVVRMLSVFRIEQAKTLEAARIERYQAQLDAMQELGRLKSEFISSVSHELRTPLNAIIGFSELLLDETYGRLNKKQFRQVENIHHSGRHLAGLVEDILDLSRIEAGRMSFRRQEVNLRETLEAAIAVARNLVAGKSLAFALKVPRDLPTVYADPRRLTQIMHNLLGNAVKFTPDGGRITVAAVLRDGLVEVSVSDTGIGIAAADHKRIFMPFEQVDRSAAAEHLGTGLGLALTRGLVEMHGGRIWLRSAPDQGSTFYFTVPLDRDQPESVAPTGSTITA